MLCARWNEPTECFVQGRNDNITWDNLDIIIWTIKCWAQSFSSIATTSTIRLRRFSRRKWKIPPELWFYYVTSTWTRLKPKTANHIVYVTVILPKSKTPNRTMIAIFALSNIHKCILYFGECNFLLTMNKFIGITFSLHCTLAFLWSRNENRRIKSFFYMKM